MFELGKEISWVVNIDAKKEMGDILELELTAPTFGKADSLSFQLEIDGYIQFDNGKKLQRKFVPSKFGQNSNNEIKGENQLGFTQEFIEPNIVQSEATLVAKMGETDIYNIGRFVNVFWEPLTIKVKMVDVSPELFKKPFQMTLNGEHDNAIRGHILQIWFFKYLLFFIALVCLISINYLCIKKL